MTDTIDRPRIVILGGGFGGLNAAKALKDAPASVTVIDRSNHHLFQPLLYQVATATLSPADVAMPIRHILHRQRNTEVLLGEVGDVDVDGKRVILTDGQALPYDILVVATGATHSYFGHPEWEALAPGLKSIADATHIRGEILSALERAERSADEQEQRALLSFIVVGAGPTGVELAGALSEWVHKVIKDDFKRLRREWVQISLLEGGPRVLPTYDSELSQRSQRDLESLGVKVRLGTMVKGIDSRGATTNEGRIDGRTVIWAAGNEASPVVKWLKQDGDRAGRIKVDGYLSVPGIDGVFVIGDSAVASDANGQPLPGLAAVATQEGTYVGRLIAAALSKSGPPYRWADAGAPFRYKNKGVLATIGRSKAIAQFGSIRLKGWFAWVVWLFVHILLLVGFRNKLSVLLQWGWSYVTWNRGAQLITSTNPRPSGRVH